ncbi:MAG: hypothetical protein L0Z62_09360 [Gemmataceae bacterium]|nr:hypothetical protein [Gemmataceae bacterium]
MGTTDNRNSVAYWQSVATRWKVVALAALVVMGMTAILAGVLLSAENSEKVRVQEQLLQHEERLRQERLQRILTTRIEDRAPEEEQARREAVRRDAREIARRFQLLEKER